MFRPPTGTMLDLLPTRHPLGDYDELALLLTDSRKQDLLADPEGDIVVLTLKAEGPRHAAAAGLDLDDVAPRNGAEHLQGRGDAHQSLLMTVPMEKEFWPVGRPALKIAILMRGIGEPAPKVTVATKGVKDELLDEHGVSSD